jgi:hypothetical protein
LLRHRSTQRAGLAYGEKSPSFNSTRCSIMRGSESIRFQAIAVTTNDIQNNVLNCRRLYQFPVLAKATDKTTDLSTLITIVIKKIKRRFALNRDTMSYEIDVVLVGLFKLKI